MSLFSIDIENIYQSLNEKGQQLKGMFCIQYPIYCIHANIIDTTPDPLDNLDKAIVDFLNTKPNFTSLQIACLMGTSKALIEQRISKLINDDLLLEKDKYYSLSSLGILVFKEKTQIRQHRQSYDFYIDGLTLQPLPKVFYGYYRSRFISEYDSHYYTNAYGETKIGRPFGPDLVHTPPDKNNIINNIINIDPTERSSFSIPNGLIEISDISFTKLSLQLLIAVSSNSKGLTKEIIDGYAFYSLSDDITYYDALRKNILSFENNIKHRIENLEFKINISLFKPDKKEQPKPIIASNWQEIDKFQSSQNKCFSFSSEDLLRVISELFLINHVVEDNIENNETKLVINITKKMLLTYPNRYKLVSSLIRQRDYYKPMNLGNNVFLLYLYFTSSDEFVNKVVSLKKKLINLPLILSREWIEECHPEGRVEFRQLLIAAGEYEILEKIDISEYMININ